MPSNAGIREPVPRPLQRILRTAVVEHVTVEQRRTYPAVLHVGVPGRAARRFELRRGDRLDHALRTEVVQAMCRPSLARELVPLVWLTRNDESHDVEDLAWAAAVTAAGGELGVALDLVVVTRRAWHDPRTGVGRVWKRVRPAGPEG